MSNIITSDKIAKKKRAYVTQKQLEAKSMNHKIIEAYRSGKWKMQPGIPYEKYINKDNELKLLQKN